MHYNFLVHSEESDFWGECRELPGCVSQGKTMDALEKNLAEALNLYLEEPSNSTAPIHLPSKEKDPHSEYIPIPVEPGIAFGILLRSARQANNLTQKQAAELLGMKNLYSYQRLERRSNPTLSILKRIKEVFPQISIDQLVETGAR
jgi:predicted RNase H-like HicB family nuclease/DNA-binding XRE family transcriptional regulator